MLTPLNSKQTPDNSILDLNGRQTYLGNSFILPHTGITLTDTSEHPVQLIRNPATSGKSLFLFTRKLSTDNNAVLVSFYFNSTPNVVGAATTPVNMRSGSANTSISQCYLSATITANGTFLAAFPSTIYTIPSDVLLIVDPGNNILITATQIGAGTTHAYVESIWYEI